MTVYRQSYEIESQHNIFYGKIVNENNNYILFFVSLILKQFSSHLIFRFMIVNYFKTRKLFLFFCAKVIYIHISTRPKI